MDSTPKWVPLLFGGVMILMGALILGALIGIVPTDENGQFFAPPLVIASLGGGLVFGGFLFWIPSQAPVPLRTLLFFAALALVALVCNWTAFAPNVVYESSTSIGIIEISGRSDAGARLAFGTAAVIVDAVFISTMIASVRALFQRPAAHK